MTPDRVHILDFHPQYDNIIVGCGFSGINAVLYMISSVEGDENQNAIIGNHNW